MAAPRGKRGTARAATPRPPSVGGPAPRNEGAGIVPELLRRAVGLGFSGFFTTEELLRKALGDTVPREWAEFAAAQTERARAELVERLAQELRRSLDRLDLPSLLAGLLETHEVQIDARIRVKARSPESDAPGVRVRFERGEES